MATLWGVLTQLGYPFRSGRSPTRRRELTALASRTRLRRPMSFSDRAVKVNGLSLHYTEWGRPGAPPVILLHGITGHARVWDYAAERLTPGFRVLALDQRGHGDSDAPHDADYRIASMADDLAAFADTLRLERFHLVGHSMGGRVAIQYGAHSPSRLGRLVLVDIGPDIMLSGLKRVREIMAQAPERIPTEEWAFEYVRRTNPFYDLDQLRHRIRHGLKRTPDSGLTWKYDKGLRDMMREGRRDIIDLWEPLGRITCPTLIVRGAESDILSPDVAKRMLEALPGGRLAEVAGAAHTVPGDKPEEFARVVRSFLDE
jgi:esterase